MEQPLIDRTAACAVNCERMRIGFCAIRRRRERGRAGVELGRTPMVFVKFARRQRCEE
jgi:hypothetical protein